MSQLSPFVRAFRALARSFEQQADNARPQEGEVLSAEDRAIALTTAIVMTRTANAYAIAATDLEQQIARDLANIGHQPHGEVFTIPPAEDPDAGAKARV